MMPPFCFVLTVSLDAKFWQTLVSFQIKTEPFHSDLPAICPASTSARPWHQIDRCWRWDALRWGAGLSSCPGLTTKVWWKIDGWSSVSNLSPPGDQLSRHLSSWSWSIIAIMAGGPSPFLGSASSSGGGLGGSIRVGRAVRGALYWWTLDCSGGRSLATCGPSSSSSPWAPPRLISSSKLTNCSEGSATRNMSYQPFWGCHRF